MAKKKEKAPGPQQEVDFAKARQDARQKHIEVPVKSSLLMRAAGAFCTECQQNRQELMDGLEREIVEHESSVSSTNGVIQALQGRLRDTDDALDSAVHTLQQTHEQLAAMQQTRINDLEEDFRSRMQQLRDFYLDNINDIKDSHSRFKNELQNLIQMIAEEEEQKGLEEIHEQSSEYDIINNRAIELEHQLQSQLDQRERSLKQQIDTALQSYRSATATQAQEYRRLKQQDTSLSQQVNAKIRDVEKMQAAINHWKAKVAQHKHEFEARNSRIKEEVNELRKHCKELRDEMDTARHVQLLEFD
ncbi:hypothetical protein ACSSS7_005123 [Eimeria intestinalis]